MNYEVTHIFNKEELKEKEYDIWRSVVLWKFADFTVEHAASVFRVENYTKLMNNRRKETDGIIPPRHILIYDMVFN
jgi:hypothetical protein